MERNPSKKTMVENGRLLSLPNDILRNIVGRLDIPQNSVMTFSDTVFEIKILDWKPGLWGILDIIFTIFFPPLITKLSLHLHCNFYKEPISSTVLNSWTRLLRARSNLQHLCLCSHDSSMIRQLLYPPTIFRIHSLVSLIIDSCITDEILVYFGNNPITLPKLRILHLGLVHCCRSLEKILRFCPSLEYLGLTVIEDDEPPWVSINDPILIAGNNLKQLYLHLESPSIIQVTIDAPKLQKFEYISLSFISMQMFDSISHVKSLIIFVSSTIRLYHNSPTKTTFPNLANLTLYASSDNNCEIFDAIVSMIQYCPNLDALELHIDSQHVIWIPKGGIAPIIKYVKLITLCTDSVYFDEHMSNLVTYLLRSAPVLKKLTVDGVRYSADDNSAKAQFHQSLLGCAKASSCCEIEFLRGYRLD